MMLTSQLIRDLVSLVEDFGDLPIQVEVDRNTDKRDVYAVGTTSVNDTMSGFFIVGK